METKRINAKREEIEINSATKKRIESYIKNNISRGYSIEAIRIALTNSGIEGSLAGKLITSYFVKNILLKPMLLFILLMLIPGILLIKPPTIGKGYMFPEIVTVESNNFTEQVNIIMNKNGTYDWQLANKGNLTSIKLSGTISGTGTAKVYLQHDKIRYLVFDSSKVSDEYLPITGLDVVDLIKNETSAKEIESEINETLELNISEEINVTKQINITEEINETEQNNTIPTMAPEEKTVTINLSYMDGTEYDKDNNGVETIDGIIDFTVQNTEFNWEVNYSKVCTKWEVYNEEKGVSTFVCYGAELCCNFVGLVPSADNWNESFNLNYGRYGAGFNNMVAAQVIYADYSLDPATAHEDISYSKLSSLKAVFAPAYYSFKDVCVESCILPNLNFDNYTLVFEIDNATVNIDSIIYTLIQIINVTNVTQNITIIADTLQQDKAVINEPVRWVRDVRLGEKAINLKIEIPSDAKNVSVNKVEKGQKKSIEKVSIEVNKEKADLDAYNLITGGAIINSNGESLLDKLVYLFSRVRKTGLAGLRPEIKEINSSLIIEEPIEEVMIEYYTEAPTATEEKINKNKKKITIASDRHYKDVLAYSYLETEAAIKNVHLFKVVNDSRVEVPFIYYDRNKNGLVDYIEWTVPALSNQTYEIIIITKAEHLDEDRRFISDIFLQVKERDGVWSEPISNNEYVRVTFEVPLSNGRDITLYPRIISGSPNIEVYEIEGTERITEFSSLVSNEYNKAILTNLNGNQDSFDLRVINGTIEIDHIIDPMENKTYYLHNASSKIFNTTIPPSGPRIVETCDSSTCGPIEFVSTTPYLVDTNITAGSIVFGVYWHSSSAGGGNAYISSYDVLDCGTSPTCASSQPICSYSGSSKGRCYGVLPGCSELLSCTQSSDYQMHNGDYLGLNVTLFANKVTMNLTYDSSTTPTNLSITEKSATDIVAPIVGLKTPANNELLVNNIVYFNCSMSDSGDGLKNVTLYGNWSGWKANETKTVTGADNLSNFTIIINEGIYRWNCYACDQAGNCGFSETNYTFIIAIPPNVTYVNVTPIIVLNGTTIKINANVTDNVQVHTVKALLTYPNASNFLNLTMPNNGGDIYYNNSYTVNIYPSGTYNITIWANDTDGNIDKKASWIAPYLLFGNRLNIVVNGSFADWIGLINVTDMLGDTWAKGAYLDLNLRYCNQIWGFDCAEATTGKPGGDDDNTFDSCTPNLLAGSAYGHVINNSVNESIIIPGRQLNVSCQFYALSNADEIYIKYYNGTGSSTANSSWRKLYAGQASFAGPNNIRSAVFTPDPITGQHWIRCMIDNTGDDNACANVSTGSDDDDINFTMIETLSEGPNLDIKSVSLSNNDTYLFAMIHLNGSVNYSNPNRYYRLYISKNASSGNWTSPQYTTFSVTTNLSISYNYRVEINGSLCYLYNSSGKQNVSDCLLANNSNTIEIGILLTDINILLGDNINATFETSSNYNSFDFAPDYRSFLSYNIVPGFDAPPTVGLSQPIDYAKLKSQDVIFNCAASDAINLSNVTLFGNWTGWKANKTNSSGTNGNYAFNLTLPEGTYLWNCRACDNNSNCSFASNNFTFTVDITPPKINIILPLAKNYSTQLIEFNVSLNENGDTCKFSLNDWASNSTMTKYTNTYFNYTNSSVPDGSYTARFWCNDSAGNINNTQNVLFAVDTTLPVVRLNNPENNTLQTIGIVIFKYNATDANLKNCTLYGNFDNTWKANQTNVTVTSGAQDTINLTLKNGTYLWNVLCYDTFGNSAFNSTNYTISIDSMKPGIILNEPIRGYFTANQYVNFNWTATDNIDTNLTCNLTINSTVNVSYIASLNGTSTNQTVAGFRNGTYYWNITCWDDANNTNTSETRNFTVDTRAPIVSLYIPLNNSWFNYSNVFINYSASESKLDTCVLYGNFDGTWKANASNSTLTSDVPVIVNLTLKDGYYIWNVICNNSAGITKWATNFTFGIDTKYPNINFTAPTPSHNSIINTNSLTVNVSVNDSNNLSTFIDLDNSLVLWMRMDANQTGEGALVYDKSIYGNNGTAYGNATQTDAGYFGKGFSFDGNGDYINCSNSSGLNLRGSLTISAWIKPTENLFATDTTVRIVDKGNQTVGFSFGISNDADWPNNRLIYVASNGWVERSNELAVTLGKWQHVAIVWNNSLRPGNLTFYVNGKFDSTRLYNGSYYNWSNGQIETNAYTGPPRDSSKDSLLIGRRYDGLRYFNGTMDDVLIWNRSLSDEEIAALYANQSNRYLITNLNVADGNHIYKAYTQDRAGNVNSTEERNVTVDTNIPVVMLIAPLNNSWQKSQQVTFRYTAYDTSLKNCTLYGNFDNTWKANATNTTVTSGSQDSLTLTLKNGTYLWNVLCYDTTEKSAFNNTNYTVTVDSVEPGITLIAPIQYYNSTLNTINFNWSVLDNLDNNLICNLTIDNTVNGSNIASLNGTWTNQSVSGLSEGSHRWNITCWDDANNTNTSQTRNFTIDSQVPIIKLDSPLNNTWQKSGLITFKYNATDANLKNCTLYGNFDNTWKANQTNITVTSGSQDTINLTLNNGTYLWNVMCYDYAGNSAFNLTNYSLTVDTIRPDIILNTPYKAYVTSNTYVDFNWTVIDNLGANLTCNLTINGTVNVSNIWSLNGTSKNQTVVGFADSLYYWNVTCWDKVNNTNTSETRNFTIDTGIPVVRLDAPLNNSWQKSQQVTFRYTAYDTSLKNCTLYGNFDNTWKANATNTSVTSGSQDSMTVTLKNGTYLWNVLCYDTTEKSAFNNTNYTVTVDSVEPGITLNAPIQYYNSTSNNINFNWTAIDNLDNNLSCNLTINSIVNVTGIASSNNTPTNQSVSGFNDGIYNWNITCIDNASNVNTSETRRFTVDTQLPVIKLDAPANNTWQKSGLITFKYNATDANLKNCTLYGNFDNTWKANQTNVTVTSGAQDTINLTLKNGTYLWNVICYDYAGNSAFNLTNYTVTVDTIRPDITLISPIHYYNSTSSNITFNWTVRDNLDGNLICNLTINNIVNVSNIASLNGTWTNWSVSGFNDGAYSWNITCWDDANNTNTSQIRNFTIDSTLPSISGETKTPEPSYNTNNVTLNATITDIRLKSVWISGNWTGAWVNHSSGIVVMGSRFSYTVNAENFSNQESVGWRYYANDSFGNLAQGALQQFTVQNRAPSNVTLLEPANNTITADSTPFFNWTNATDLDLDNITYTLQIDNDSDFSSPEFEKYGLNNTNYTLSLSEALAEDVYYWRVYSNDSYTTNVSLIWQFEINPSQAVGIDLSINLNLGVGWKVETLPQFNLPAMGNNLDGATIYNITISASGTTADLYIKGDKNLTAGLDILDLSNEMVSYNISDPTVPSGTKSSLTANFNDNPIGTSLQDKTVVYLKFYLNVSGGQAPGMYKNNVSIKVVPNGYSP